MTPTTQTPEQIFQTVALHLLTQNQVALSSGGDCAYRGAFGLKCAIGCLIPDALYRPEMEGACIDDLVMSEFEDYIGAGRLISDKILGRVVGDLLNDLQQIHDDASPHGNAGAWRRRLASMAKDYGFAMPEIPPTAQETVA